MSWARVRCSAWPTWLGLAAIIVLAGLTLLPVALSNGWPMNHEFNLPWNFNSFYLRTLLYAEHMQQGDWFPIWSITDNDGFGSPQPLMYHKLFYLLSGALYLFTGQMKASILMSLWFWLVVGASGTAALCRTVGCTRWLAWCGGAMLLLANYTVTNWLVRGAMAEFAAAMLVPWVLAVFLTWLRQDSRPYLKSAVLAVLLSAVFLAHSVLAFYLILLLGCTVFILLGLRQAPIGCLKPGPLVSAAALFALITGPYIGAMRLISSGYDMQRIIPTPFLPENQIKPWLDYIWDSKWQWGKVWDSYTVQLDLPVLALLVIGLFLLIAHAVQKKLRHVAVNQLKSLPMLLLALALMTALALLLQTVWAVPFYQRMPGAAFIQFPWRLLGVLTPALIALSLGVWQLQPLRKADPALLVFLLAMGWLCGAWSPINYGQTPAYKPELRHFRFGAFGEYIPATAGTEPPAERYAATLKEVGCSVEVLSPKSEVLVQNFRVRCASDTTVALPVFASPLHQLSVKPVNGNANRPRQPCIRSKDDQALCMLQVNGGEAYLVEVQSPRLGMLLKLY